MKSKIIGFTNGSFDLIYSEHLSMFREAKERCDYLIVGLKSDATIDCADADKPNQTLEERTSILSEIKSIDEIIPYHTEQELYGLLTTISPDIRMIPEDWKDKKYTGYDLPIDVFFNSRSHKYSTLKKQLVNKDVKELKWWQVQ